MSRHDKKSTNVFLPNGRLREDLLTEEARRALDQSLHLTRTTQWDCVRSPHVFMGLLALPDPCVRQWAELLKADIRQMLEQFQSIFHQEQGERDAVVHWHREFISDNVIHVLRESLERANANLRETVTQTDLLVTLLASPNSIVAECFERIGVTAEHLAELAVVAEQSCADRDTV